MKLKPLCWKSFTYQNRKFILKAPITIKVAFEDGHWIYEYEELELFAYDYLKRDSLNAFKMEFAACWDTIALERDERLTQDAIFFKKKMLVLVKDVRVLT